MPEGNLLTVCVPTIPQYLVIARLQVAIHQSCYLPARQVIDHQRDRSSFRHGEPQTGSGVPPYSPLTSISIIMLFFRCLFPNVLSPQCVFLEPVDFHVHLEKLVSQLAPPVRLPGSNIQMGRNTIRLECAVKFH